MSDAIVVDARKERFDAEAVWNLLKSAKQIIIAKGKKVATWEPQDTNKIDILSQAMGPSQNLRAPTFRMGDTYIIGFNPELYAEQF